MNATHLATQIIDQVDQLPYSDTNSYELMSLANKAYVLLYAQAGNSRKEGLQGLKQIIERQLQPLLGEELILAERIKVFHGTKTNLACLLKAYAA